MGKENGRFELIGRRDHKINGSESNFHERGDWF